MAEKSTIMFPPGGGEPVTVLNPSVEAMKARGWKTEAPKAKPTKPTTGPFPPSKPDADSAAD